MPLTIFSNSSHQGTATWLFLISSMRAGSLLAEVICTVCPNGDFNRTCSAIGFQFRVSCNYEVRKGGTEKCTLPLWPIKERRLRKQGEKGELTPHVSVTALHGDSFGFEPSIPLIADSHAISHIASHGRHDGVTLSKRNEGALQWASGRRPTQRG